MPDLIVSTWWENEEVDDFVMDVLTVAYEGGIDYWARCKAIRDGDGRVKALYDFVDAEGSGDVYHSGVIAPMHIWSVLNGIANGQYDFSSKVREWILQDLRDKEVTMIDVEAADVIVQLAVFGEIVYG